ncbi:hypothetical protein EWM64_g10141, partial [Hericium alpestre]
KYEFIFRWAALQAMGSSPNEHKTSTHCIFFLITRTERMTGPFPSPFIISDAKCITHEAASDLVYGEKALSPGDVKSSLEIRRGGGVGRAIAVFLVQGADTTITWHFERYDLLEQLPSGRVLLRMARHRDEPVCSVIRKGFSKSTNFDRSSDSKVTAIPHLVQRSHVTGPPSTLRAMLLNAELGIAVPDGKFQPPLPRDPAHWHAEAPTPAPQKYEWLFRWVLYQTISTFPHNHTHLADRAPARCIPQPLPRARRQLAPAALRVRAATSPLTVFASAPATVARDQEAGDEGLALALFVTTGPANTPGVFRMRHYELREPLGGVYYPGWKAQIKGVLNGGLSLADITRVIETMSSEVSSAHMELELRIQEMDIQDDQAD